MFRPPALRQCGLYSAVGGVGCLTGLAAALGAMPPIVVVVAGIWGPLLALAAPLTMLLVWFAAGPTTGGWIYFEMPGGLPAMTIDRALLAVLFPVCVARWLFRRELRPFVAAEVFMVVFLIVAIGSMIVSPASPALFGGWKRDVIFLAQSYVIPFTAFFLAHQLVRTHDAGRRLIDAVIITGLIIGGAGLAQFFLGIDFFAPGRFEAATEHRAMGPLASPAEFGMIVTAAWIGLLIRFGRTGHPVFRIALAAGMAVLIVAILVSKTRSVWLGAVIAIGLIMFLERRWRRTILLVGGFLIAAVLVAVPYLTDLRRFVDRVTELSPIYNRAALVSTAAHMVWEKPAFGHGFARFTFEVNKRSYVMSVADVPTAYAADPGVPHNEILHVWVLVGLVGLVPLLLIHGLIIGAALRARRPGAGSVPADEGRRWARELGLMCLAVSAMYWVNGMLVDVGLLQYANTLLFTLGGAATGLAASRTMEAGR